MYLCLGNPGEIPLPHHVKWYYIWVSTLIVYGCLLFRYCITYECIIVCLT